MQHQQQHGANADERGASLTDLMMAIMIGLVLTGSVLSLVLRQSHLSRTNIESSLAVRAAYNTIERIRSLPQSAFPSLTGTGFDVPGQNGAAGGLAAVPGDADGLPGQINILTEETSGSTVLYRVITTVTWRGVNGRRKIILQSLMGERK